LLSTPIGGIVPVIMYGGKLSPLPVVLIEIAAGGNCISYARDTQNPATLAIRGPVTETAVIIGEDFEHINPPDLTAVSQWRGFAASGAMEAPRSDRWVTVDAS
jgi:hypothetical protein